MTNSNEQHQFDLFYVHDNVFKGNTYKKNMITGLDFASRYKVSRAIKTKKKSEVSVMLEVIYRKDGMFK